MTDVRDGDALNRQVADHVSQVRESLERGREELDRQRRVLAELYGNPDEEDAAA